MTFRTKRLKKLRKLNPKTNGRIWGCNRELGAAKGARLEIDNRLEQELRNLEKSKKVHVFKSDYFTIYYTNYKNLQDIGCNQLFREMTAYLFKTFGTPYQMKENFNTKRKQKAA